MEQPKEKKTANKKQYMATYMRKRYNDNPKMSRLIKQKSLIKQKYIVPDDVCTKYGIFLYNVVKSKQLLSEMSPELLQSFFSEFETLHFEPLYKMTAEKEEEEL